MGVTLHYRGRMRHKEDIQKLTNEVQDLCESAQWKYNIWDGKGPKPLHGITFQTHPDSEHVWLTFNKEGVMHNFFSIDGDIDIRDEEGYSWNFTKTQFAGPETHIVICKLLRFLSDKYFEDWKVQDEGLYYDTGDATFLTQSMDFISDAIKDFTETLEALPAKPDESLEDFMIGILQKFANRNPAPKPPE